MLQTLSIVYTLVYIAADFSSLPFGDKQNDSQSERTAALLVAVSITGQGTAIL